MRVAVIGAGITGLGAALALSEEHDVHLFERDTRFGGHANTVDVRFGDEVLPVDTGFIVFNEAFYPNLTGLFQELGVASKYAEMSFALSVKGGRIEWSGRTWDSMFTQRQNLVNPRFLFGLREIARFNRTIPELLESGALKGLTLGDLIERYRFSDWFRDCYILPFGGAIWSTPTGKMLEFPAESFVNFFVNHGLVTYDDTWRTVAGGSREYVDRIVRRLGARAHGGAEVVSVRRAGGQPTLRFADGSEAVFDQVVMASHAPQTARMIADLDTQERRILSAFRTSDNRTYLHSDPALMPRRRKAWASWNFLSPGQMTEDREPASVSYWMHTLQGLPEQYPIFVSLNPVAEPDPALVHGTFNYQHPIFDAASFAAQEEIGAIQGRGGIWYAGAWLGYGFHEDGLRSGLRVAGALGARPHWAKGMPEPAVSPFAEAAE